MSVSTRVSAVLTILIGFFATVSAAQAQASFFDALDNIQQLARQSGSNDKYPGYDLRSIQRQLNSLGYDAGSPDGIMGRLTRNAIEEFQRDIGAPPTGVLSPDELAGLYEAPLDAVSLENGAPSGEFNILYDTDLPYSDFRSGMDEAGLRRIELHQCVSACSVDRQCLAFTYNSKARVCFLKSAVPIATPFSGAISGVRLAEAALEAPGDRTLPDRPLTALEIAALQRQLGALGYDVGVADGIAGALTLSATAAFRRDRGISGGEALSIELLNAVLASETARTGLPDTASVDFGDPSLRVVQPAFAGGRLLTGFPVLFGDHKGTEQRLPMRSGDVWSGALNISMYVDLALLKAFPDILLDPRDAFFYAERFLVGGELDRLLVECRGGCSYGDIPYRGWRGDNEFQREASYRAFVDTIAPRLIAKAPDLPFGVLHVLEMELQPYDDEKGGFPLRSRRVAGHRLDAVFGTVYTARTIRLEADFQVPDLITVRPEEAETFLARVGEDRFVYLALAEQFNRPHWSFGTVAAPLIEVTLDYAELFAEPQLITSLHRFTSEGPISVAALNSSGVAGPGILDIASWNGTLLIGGRVLAVTRGTADHQFEDEGLPEGRRIGSNPFRLVRDYGLASNPRYLDRDGDALAVLSDLDEPLLIKILERALERPLTEQERGMAKINANSDSLVFSYLSTPFLQRRAAEAVRAFSEEVFPDDLPAQPLPLRVYCFADVDQYDFETSSFPLRGHTCNEQIVGLPYGAEPAGPFLQAIAMPMEEAEAYEEQQLSGSRRVLVSFEVDATIGTSETEAEITRTATLSAPHNFLLHRTNSLRTALLSLGEDRGVTPGEAYTADPNRRWILDADERLALLELAGPAKALPMDGRLLFDAAAASLGLIEGQGNHLGGDMTRGELFFASGNLGVQQQLAAALGVPTEQLLPLAYISDADPLSAFYGLLPAPLQTYGREMRPDRYGRSSLRYNSDARITGIHRFDVTGKKPILIATLEPLESRFIDPNGGNETVETFDLRAPTMMGEYEILNVPVRAVQIAQAASAEGMDPRETLRNVVDWGGLDVFQREELLDQYVDVSTAPPPPEAFWTFGMLSMGEYDFDSGTFVPYGIGIGSIDVLRPLDVPPEAVRFELNDPGAFDIAMEPEAARLFAQNFPPYTEVAVRALVRPIGHSWNTSSLTLKVEVLEIELVDRGDTLTVRDQERVLLAYAPKALPSTDPVEDVPALDTHPPIPESSFDLFGVRLGDDADQAVIAVGAELLDAITYTMTSRDRASLLNTSEWEPFGTGTLLHSPQSNIVVAIHTEPPAGGNAVTAILRAQDFSREATRPHPQVLVDRLLERYGTPEWSNGSTTHVWHAGPVAEAGAGCNIQAKAATTAVEISLGRMRHESGASAEPLPWRNPQTGSALEGFLPFPPIEHLVPEDVQCPGEYVFAWIDVDGDDGLAASFHLVLIGLGEITRLAVENEAAALQRNADEVGAKGPDIRF